MNQETYEALKRIIRYVDVNCNGENRYKDIEKIKDWIDETAKEHEEEK